MELVAIADADEPRLRVLTELLELARKRDDPAAFEATLEDVRNEVCHGWDLHPAVFSLLFDAAGVAVAALRVHVPVRDNVHAIQVRIVVHPDHRRVGHGTLLLDEVLQQARALGRTTVWVGAAADDPASTGFLRHHGFGEVSHDTRQVQIVRDVDQHELDRLEREAQARSARYSLERVEAPDADLLESLVGVTAAMNDAPTGDLAIEDQVFDLDRVRDMEEARRRRGERARRVVARHNLTGEVVGHTCVVIRPWAPHEAYQEDTTVATNHRGHRLGLTMKVAMLRWIAEAEPDLRMIDTWNNVDNTAMILVNEALGYRPSAHFVMFERHLDRPLG